MPDLRFHTRSGPFSLSEIADRVGAKLATGAVAHSKISDVASLASAGPNDISFISDPALIPTLATARCGACLVKAGTAVPDKTVALEVADPRAAFALVARMFYPARTPVVQTPPTIAASAEIAPSAVIGGGAVIAERVYVGPNSTVGPGVQIGDDTFVAANVSLSHCLIGARCILHPGVRIGQDGFGFVPGPTGLAKMPQLGRVIIGSDVEIGANSCVDRGALGDTEIGDGTKMDNMVQIGHNVRVGRHCVIVAQAGIAGSATVGDGVMMGGQVAISDHVNVGNRAQIAGKSGVMRDIAPGEAVMGYPAQPIRQFWQGIAMLSRLTKRDK